MNACVQGCVQKSYQISTEKPQADLLESTPWLFVVQEYNWLLENLEAALLKK